MLNAASNFFLKAEKPKPLFFKVVIFRCTPYSSPCFLYPENARGEQISGQHTICFHKLLVFLSKHRADRFLLWWLFLHRRLRPRQRGSSCDERLSLSFWWFLAKKCFPFLSGKPKKVFQLFLEQSLSASMQGVIVTFFRLLLLSNGASPLRSPLLVPVKSP